MQTENWNHERVSQRDVTQWNHHIQNEVGWEKKEKEKKLTVNKKATYPAENVCFTAKEIPRNNLNHSKKGTLNNCILFAID